MEIKIKKYNNFHKNKINRIIHILTLFEIPYSLYLIIKKKYIKSISYYIFFNHIITFFVGHILFEKNHKKVFKDFYNGISNKNIDTLLFFSFLSPILRIIDLLNFN